MTALIAPRIGDRVIIDCTLMGETVPVEVIVSDVWPEADGRIRIIGRPEGTVSVAFARHEWREAV